MAVATKKRGQAKQCQVCKTRKAVSRGNCASCLRNVYRMIEAGELTEQQAIAKGVIAKSKKTGRPLGNAVRRKLAAAS